MTDQLSLSIWVPRHGRAARLEHYEKLLRLFPFSQRPQPQSLLSIHGVASTEPPLLERPMNGPVDIAEVMAALADYQGEDVGYTLESWWDLWQFDTDWNLLPARVGLSCFGPQFDNGTDRAVTDQEDLRIDFGVDSHYLPRLDVPGSARLTESNIRSLLRVVQDLDAALPLSKRKLETESGENFADRLQHVLSADEKTQ